MRPVKIEFQAFGPYAGYEMVDFETISENGLFLICGKTGTGKTTILDAMTFALYGKSSGHGRDDFGNMRCTKADPSEITFVKFEFENNGEYYIFERRLEPKRKNLSESYSLQRKGADGSWEVLLENAKAKDLNQKAVELIGLEYDQFRQVIVLPQGQFEKLLTSSSDEKEKILTSIFGEEKWKEIAECLFQEASLRKDTLKEKRDRITNSLLEENCTTVAELMNVIEGKQFELATLEKNYKEADYESQKKELQDVLAKIKRFEDLHKAKAKVGTLEARKIEIDELGRNIEIAKRAENVRGLIEAVEQTKLELTKRLQQEQDAKENAMKYQKHAEEASAALLKHSASEPEVEQAKVLKIQYEGKRADYEGIDAETKLLVSRKKEEAMAIAEEEKAQRLYDDYAPKLVDLNHQYNQQSQLHKELLEQYLAGITGEIAETLVEGQKCPVCGSISHPCKAVKADDSVTKAMVDAKKGELDQIYNVLQTTLLSQNQAKTALEAKHKVTENCHNAVIMQDTKLKSMQAAFVDGIDSLQALITAITKLDDSVRKYTETKKHLEQSEKSAKERYTEANAKIEPAKKEVELARAQAEKAQELLEIGLAKNGFETADAAKAHLLKSEEIDHLRKTVYDYEAEVKSSKENLNELQVELANLSEPDVAAYDKQMAQVAEAEKTYTEKKTVLSTETQRLLKKKTNLEAEGEGIEDMIREAEEDFKFAKSLRGDSGIGLQRYVLGIMFSSVIAAANKMLELVHDGRYQLYRSDEKVQGKNKTGLELKVFDKNSGDHAGRFVNTLSGGEKFLVSLALSIGMSTVAQRSGIKIEALFIDEGFGSLDEDSIEDAMNVLQSVQQANGLVGIISHVQILQSNISTKLKVVENEKGSHIVKTIG